MKNEHKGGKEDVIITLQEARELKALTDSVIENMNVISGDRPPDAELHDC